MPPGIFVGPQQVMQIKFHAMLIGNTIGPFKKAAAA
jgi:hypothetical protein